MTRDQSRAILGSLLSLADGDELEATLGGGTHRLTRFANNEVTQNVSERRFVLSVRVIRGRRTGRATGNDFSPDGIVRLVRRAREATALQPEIEGLLPLPGPQDYLETEPADPETASSSAEDRLGQVARAVERCSRDGLQAAGIFETGEGSIGEYGEIGPLAIANSRGLFAYHCGTDARFLVSALDGAASGWAGAESHRVGDLHAEALAARAAEKAIRSRNPVRWEPGRYTVVLEPAAVADLLQDMAWVSFGALLVQEGRSFLSGRMGRPVMGSNVTIRDDPFHPLHRGVPFDAEGMPTRPVTIIDRGVALSPVYDRHTASVEGRESTGHGLPVPNTQGPVARHLILEGGDGSVEDLVRSVERGLLVTRVWYTNLVDAATVTLTGMTRDGLFAIENGRIGHAVRNFRFNQSVVEMLGQVEALSRVERVGGVVCPGLRVRDFHMSSVTEF